MVRPPRQTAQYCASTMLDCSTVSFHNISGGRPLWLHNTRKLFAIIFNWAPFQHPIRRLIVRSREVSMPRNLYLEQSDRCEIWQAPWQHCCRRACQISQWYDNFKLPISRLRDFTRSYDKTSYRILKRGPGCHMWYKTIIKMSSYQYRDPNVKTLYVLNFSEGT